MPEDRTDEPPTPNHGDGAEPAVPPASSTGDLAGLDRLLPQVDGEAAAAAFARARSRGARRHRGTRLLVAASVLAIVGMIGIVAASIMRDDPRRDAQVSTEPEPEDGSPDPTDGSDEPGALPAEGGPVEATATEHGVEITLSAPAEARVGDLLETTITITNISNEQIGLGNGSACDPGATVTLGPLGSDGNTADAQAFWDGQSPLAGHLRSQSGNPRLHGRSPDDLWVRELGCTAQYVPPEVIEPGNAVEISLVVPVTWGIDGVPAEMDLVATSSVIAPPGQSDPEPAARASVTMPIRLVDDPARAGSVDTVLDPGGVIDAPGLADWIELSTPDETWNIAPGAEITQSWRTDLHWRDGRWVLWIDPFYMDGSITGPLRVRYDPERGEVVDVRTVASGNGGSADDPGAPPGYPQDVIIYEAD